MQLIDFARKYLLFTRSFQQYPTFIVQETKRILLEAAETRAPYDEVAAMVNALTKECNDFRRFCISNGVPAADCPQVETAASMEEVVE